MARSFPDLRIPTLLLILFLLTVLAGTSGCISDPTVTEVVKVEKNSPAYNNSIETGMTVTRIIYRKDNDTVRKNIDDYHQLENVISILSPGQNITVHLRNEDGGEIVREDITLGNLSDRTGKESDEGKAYLGVVVRPPSGVVLTTEYGVLYLLLIIIMAILIFFVVLVEKWVERRCG